MRASVHLLSTRFHCQGVKRSSHGLLWATAYHVTLMLQEIASLVETQSAMQISLNPITKANTEKALQRFTSHNSLAIGAQTIASIAEAANGDLRNALETLQLTCAGVPVTEATNQAKKNAKVWPPHTASAVRRSTTHCFLLLVTQAHTLHWMV